MLLPYLFQPSIIQPISFLTLLLTLFPNWLKTFFGLKGDNKSGKHPVGWNIAALDKAEGRLGIRDLRIAKIALMAKLFLASLTTMINCGLTLLELSMASIVPGFHISLPNVLGCIEAFAELPKLLL